MTYIDEFLRGKIAVSCQTEEGAAKFLRWCKDEYDIKWNGGEAIDENYTRWKERKDQMTYIYGLGLSTGLQFGSADYHREIGVDIVSYNEILGEQYSDADFEPASDEELKLMLFGR